MELAAFLVKPNDFNLEFTVKAILCHFALGYLFFLIFYLAVIRIFIPWSKETWIASRSLAFWGGAVSVAIDSDHIVRCFGWTYGRQWHIPAAIIFGLIAIFTLFWLIRWRLDKSFDHLKEIGKVTAVLVLCDLSLCIDLHVLEDYLVNWF